PQLEAALDRIQEEGRGVVVYLYRVDRAMPVRPMTAARWAALAKANAARRRCPACRRDAGYVIPASLGTCTPCAYPDPEGSERSH
ncbi:RRQRL motif-containing zinc-binding protein, partial [Streptomyces nigra]